MPTKEYIQLLATLLPQEIAENEGIVVFDECVRTTWLDFYTIAKLEA